jgi:iron complex outermembrane receptor protein
VSLQQLADQAGIQIFYEESIAEGLNAPALKARLSPVQALTLLLRGTELEFVASNDTLVVRRQSKAAVSKVALDVASTQRTRASRPAQAPADTDNTAGGLEQIIVTAQRRSQNIQDTPVTVQALTADTLAAAGASSTIDIATMVPNLTFNASLTAGAPYIRGVGQNTGSLGVESPVAIYIDGVYLVAPASGLFDLANIERVEVLKGPQGTLFGRNTTGGVIQVITKEPQAELDWSASAGFANYETYSGSAYLTGEVAPNLSSSISANLENQNEGWINNTFLDKRIGDSENVSLQNKWLWQVTPDTQIGLNALYLRKFGYLGTTVGVYPGYIADDKVTPHLGDYTTSAGIPTWNRDKQGLVALTIRHDLDWSRLTSISAWHRLWDRFNFVQNAEPLHSPFLPGVAAITQYIKGDQETFTQELQLQAPSSADFQWTLGMYYLDDKTELDVKNFRENQFIFQGSGSAKVDANQDTRSYAAYADGSITVLPDTRLTLGARYSNDRKRVYGTSEAINAAGNIVTTTPQAPGGIFQPLETPKSWNEWTYRAVLDHHFTPDFMAYGSYNRGFKSGLYNISFFGNQPVDPEIVDGYEVGLKTELFHQHLRLNVAGFYYDYQDVQLRQVVSNLPGVFLLYNAATSSVQGLDVDLTARPTQALTIRAGLGLLDAKYDSFEGAPFALRNPVTQPLPPRCSGSSAALPPSAATAGGTTTVSCDASGLRMMRSPKVTANLGLSYSVELSGGSGLLFTVSDSYNDGFFWDPDHQLRQAPYHDVRASVTWAAPSEKWDIRLWGSNLTDEVVYTTASGGPTSIFGPGEPRRFGIEVSFRH